MATFSSGIADDAARHEKETSNSSQSRFWSASRHVAALDGVRGVAILLVFMEHFGGGRHSRDAAVRWTAYAMRLGWIGVSLFFVLSGFLITGILWDSIGQPHWWRRFYLRRSLRIFPLYYAVLACAAIIGFICEPQLLHKLWIYIFYLQNIGHFASLVAALPGDRIILDHFWSLAVEEQFYLVWPFVLLLLCGWQTAMRLCIAVWVGSFALRLGMAAGGLPENWLYRFPLSRAGELCLGGFLALCIRGDREIVLRTLRLAKPALIGSAAMLAILAIATSGDFETSNAAWTTAGIFFLPVLFASVIALCLQAGSVQKFFSYRILRWIGKISYGLYVYHLVLRPACAALAQRLIPKDLLLQDLCTSLISVAAALAVASLSFYTFERYFLGLKRRFPVPPRDGSAPPREDEESGNEREAVSRGGENGLLVPTQLREIG